MRDAVRSGSLFMLGFGFFLSLALAIHVTSYSHSPPQRAMGIAAITGSITLVMVLFWRWVVVIRARFHPVAGALAAALAVPIGVFVAFLVQVIGAALTEPESLSGLLYSVPLSVLFAFGTVLNFPRAMGAALLIAAVGAYLVGRWCHSRSVAPEGVA
jgi:hypothetical protein